MWFISHYLRSNNELSEVQISNLHYLSIQNVKVRIIFGFSLYIIFLLVILVAYFRRGTQDVVGGQVYWNVISQTLKHVWNMSNFNTISNSYGYLALFVSKTPSVIWYFIINLIPSNPHSYLALFVSKSMIIFICFHYLIIFFKLSKITWTLHRVFSFPIWTSI